jgi:hypothetical protein
MIGVGSSLMHKMLGSFTPLDDPVLLIEKQHILHEKPNVVPRIKDIWLLVMLLGGFAKFIKLKHKDRLQEANQIIRVEFFRCEAYVLSWMATRVEKEDTNKSFEVA